MTKKHYEAIAAAFRAYITTNTGANIARPIAKDLADYFATDNPKFDRARFLQACGIEQGPEAKHPLATQHDCATNAMLGNPDSKHFSGCYACGYTGR